MSSSVVSDFVGGFFRVIATAVSAKTKSVLLDLAGAPSPDDPSDDQKGEVAKQQLAYGALGIVSNPLDPGTAPDGTPWQADVYAVRSGDEVIPLAWFDPRIDGAFPNGVPKGTIALAGYGKGFHSIGLVDPADPNSTTTHVFYAPYEFDGDGVPAKAHAIIIDTKAGNESIQLVHGDGYFFTAKAGSGWTMAVDSSTAMAMTPGSGPGVAGKITMSGNLVVGAGATLGDPNTALPAAIAPKLAAYISALETDIATALTAIGAGALANGATGAAAFTGGAAARAALVALIPAPTTTVA